MYTFHEFDNLVLCDLDIGFEHDVGCGEFSRLHVWQPYHCYVCYGRMIM